MLKRKQWFGPLIILILSLVLQQCRKAQPPSQPPVKAVPETIHVQKPAPKPVESPPVPPVNYFLIPLDSAHHAWLQLIRSADTLNILIALNRADSLHLFRQDTLVIPSTYGDMALYSPFPDSLPLLDSVRKMLLCSYRLQAFAAYENGKRVRWGPCSLGKKATPTPTGLLHTNWKAKQTISTVNGEWTLNWYFNLESSEGVSMHQYELPGFPASHACVRLMEEDAQWLYAWAEQWLLADARHIAAPGTPVLIFGSYPFGKAKPWRRLDDKHMAPKHPGSDLASEISPFLVRVLSDQAMRDTVLSRP